ncbi:MAG: MerR family transcriptional regulator [Anaerolineae bacterium]|nr:MerR family transcriptional regulator [Anaerolineae bacterium]
MMEPERFGDYDDTPVYTIKTVVQQTGITPATLRAWERRYNVLSPGRSEGGYRLYSERDIAILRWLKQQTDGGVSISSAVALLERRRQASRPIVRPRGEAPPLPTANRPRTTAALAQELVAGLLAFQEERAAAVLTEAFAIYGIEDVAEEIIAPALIEIGERWHRGEATVVQEHFATAFLRHRLATLFHAYEPISAGPLVLTGSVPGEWHDVGILLVSLLLRRSGWRVIYLGQNVPTDHLIGEIARLRPRLVCLSATTPESEKGLIESYEAITRLPEPRPRLILGGRLLNIHPNLRARFPHAYVGETAREVIAAIGRP